MPYYYNYGDFLANNIYCILLIPVMILSLWAQAQVSETSGGTVPSTTAGV